MVVASPSPQSAVGETLVSISQYHFIWILFSYTSHAMGKFSRQLMLFLAHMSCAQDEL